MEERDERLWQIAQKRAAFKKNLYSYLVINAFLWGIWLIRAANDYNGFPWPAWVSLGWGIGIAFHYFDAYHKSGETLEQREYDKLKQEQNK
jgi:hypothetical protein